MKDRLLKFFSRKQDDSRLCCDAARYWNQKSDIIKEYSHFCGIGRWDSAWMLWGNENLKRTKEFFERFDSSFFASPRVVIDWGCGGGANARWLCQRFEKVYLVDVSAQSLEECEKQLKKDGFSNYEKILLGTDMDPQVVLSVISPDSVDFIFSTACFQHFPTKKYAQQVLEIISGLLRNGGFGLIQIRYDDHSGQFNKQEKYFVNAIAMIAFDDDEFTDRLKKVDLQLLGSEYMHEDLYKFCFIRKNTVKG